MNEDYEMTAQEYLEQLTEIKENIKSCEDERKEQNSRLLSISSPALSQNGNRNNDQFNARFTIIMERIEAIDEEICSYIAKESTILDQIREIGDATFSGILHRRYFLEKDFDTIAFELGYSTDYLKTLHRKALQEFENKFLKVHTK